MRERRSFRAMVVTAATACLLGAGQHPAGAEEDPGAPSGLQQGIDSAVPAPALPPGPPVEGLTPEQAALLHAVHSPPTGDPFFDATPPGLAGLNPGDILEQRDVTVTAAFVVLDGIRAVRGTPGFGGSRFALGGYSGGAIASHGAAMLLGEYAPELREAVVGAAMGGLVTDNRVIADRFNGNFASGVLLAVVLAYSREHPEILDRMNHLATWAATSPLNAVCGQAIGVLGVIGIPIDVAANVADALDSAVAEEIFARTDLSDRTSRVPLYIYHGAHDLWIPFEGARELYQRQCARGVAAVFRSDPGEHIIALASGFPGAADWLGARLRGEPAPSEC